jgi:LEA14-like dessication related protein
VALWSGAIACRDAVERVFTQPTIAVRGVRLATIGIGGGSIEVEAVVTNPNAYALTARTARYRFLVRDSIEVGNGQLTQEFTVPARDSARVSLPIDVDFRGVRATLREAAADGTVGYRIVGDVVLDTPIGDRTFAFDQAGRFDVGRMR